MLNFDQRLLSIFRGKSIFCAKSDVDYTMKERRDEGNFFGRMKQYRSSRLFLFFRTSSHRCKFCIKAIKTGVKSWKRRFVHK